jgi:uncharacterized membrane protein YoaK (UPF0700 family)
VLSADARHGPLPAMLLGLTVVTGMVDAVSILSLGRVFVANMTGNVAFIGFGVARAPGFSITASVVALGAFLAGAAAGGAAGRRLGGDRAVLLAACTAGELVLVAGAAIVAALVGEPFGEGAVAGLAAMLAVAMGMQNAVARRLAVPDLTTTVLTMTLTGMAADADRSTRARALPRRLLAVATMLGGALAGAVLVLHAGAVAALAVLAAVLAAVAVVAAAATRRPGEWRRSDGARRG